MKKTSFEDALILNAIRLTRFFVRLLPIGVSLAGARGIGRLVYWTSSRRRIAYKNLRMVFAQEKSSRELKRIALASVENLVMSGVEMLRIPELTPELVKKHFRIEGKENFEPYVKKGQGIIFLTGHFGSWELLNIVSGLEGYPMAALARVQKHPRSDAYLNSLRVSKGSQVIHKGMPIREILRALKLGRIVGILSDQDGGRNGCFVDFFNRLSSTPSGAAAFSLRTGAPIFPAFIVREKDFFHRVVVEKPIEIPDASVPVEEAERRILQKFADALEKHVRRHPEQWLWAHRRWKSSPDRNVVILSDGKSGHLNQSLALYDAVCRERQAHGFPVDRIQKKIIQIRYKSVFLKKCWKALGLLFGGCPPFGERLLRRVLMDESANEVIKSYADIVISCGSSLTEINLWMKKENLAKSMVAMSPKPFTRRFDAVVVPRHDRVPEAKNIFETDGALSPWGQEEMKREAQKLEKELGLSRVGKYLGILVGGDASSGLKFEETLFKSWVHEWRRAALSCNATLLLTTSRRTPAWADRILKETFLDRALCPILVIANEVNRPGVVAGILGLSDVVVVSGESMSMISEAVFSGKPVIVFSPWEKALFKRKYKDALNTFERKGVVFRSTPEGFKEILKQQLSRSVNASATLLESVDSALSQAAKRML